MSEIKKKKICVLDFDTGNIGSVSNLLEKLNLNYCVSNKNDDLEDSSHLILPGVGSFSKAITKLKQKIDITFLNKQVLQKKKPILGICVGMQLMAEIGNEFGINEGLGWIKGSVDLIKSNEMPLPHIGWNEVNIEMDNKIFDGIDSGHDFYFVNSYYFNIKDNQDMIGSTNYGSKFPSIVNKGNIYGVQFHPEKSQKYGQKIILNFING
jgi:imidazole glycerol-phosphate synthase subunit HisH